MVLTGTVKKDSRPVAKSLKLRKETQEFVLLLLWWVSSNLQGAWKSQVVMVILTQERLWNEGFNPPFSLFLLQTLPLTLPVQRGFLVMKDTEFTFDWLPNMPFKSSVLLYICTSGVLGLGLFAHLTCFTSPMAQW